MIDLGIVILYMVVVLAIGFHSGLKVRDLKDYSVAKNSFSTFVMFAAIFATLVGGGATMGVSEKVFSTGVVFLIVCFVFVIRDLLTAFFLVPKFEQFEGCLTVGDIMGLYYGKVGKVIVGIAGTMQCSFFVGMQVAALGHLSDYFLGIPYWIGNIIGIGIVIIYSAFGGIRAVTLTDVLQFSVLIVAIPVTFTIGIDMVGGFYGLWHSVPVQKLSFMPESHDQIRFYSLLLVFIFPYMNPALVQRLLAGKNTRQNRAALVASSLGRIPYYAMVGVLGLVAYVLEPTLQADMAFPYLVNHILPVGVKGFVVAGVLAVIMSTADSYLHVTGLLLTHDVIAPLTKGGLSDKKELRIARFVTIIIGAVAMWAALSNSNIIELNILAYGFWLPAIFIPLVSAVLGYRRSVRTFLISGACGLSAYVIWKIFFYEKTSVDCLLPAIIANATVFFGSGYIKKKWRSRGQSTLPAKFSPNDRTSPVIARRFNVGEFFRRSFQGIQSKATHRIDIFGAPLNLFVLFSVANLCFVPFIFATTSGHKTADFIAYLRALAGLMSFILIIKDFWPQRLLRFLPIYWYLTLFVCLPYLTITSCLFSSCAIEWVIDLVLTIFILGILVDWKTYLLSIVSGTALASLSFALFGDLRQFDPQFGNFPIMLYAILVSLVAGAMFSRVKERVLMDKLVTFEALGGTIAHEMRTPLSAIQISASGLKEYLPVLVEGYNLALSNGLMMPKVSRLALDSVENAPERMRYICASTLNIIDMLLVQLRDKDWNSHMSICSMEVCVKTALNEYCFRENEKELLEAHAVKDFVFMGNVHLVVHILFNLMRNSYTFIKSEKKGAVTLWTSESPEQFHLHFRDTAKGIDKRYVPSIFDHGFSKRNGGSGVGLHYCKKMMSVMGGKIRAESVDGEFSEFVLSFPRIVDV